MTQPAPQPAQPRQVTVTRMNWSTIFDFTRLFRAFRLAINPAKIMLALFAILLIYVAGRIFDAAWGPQVYSNEIAYYQSETPKSYARHRDTSLRDRTSWLHVRLLSDLPELPADQREKLRSNPSEAYKLLKKSYIEDFHKKVQEIADQRKAQEALGPTGFTTPDTPTPAQREQDDRASEARTLNRRIEEARNMRGKGIFVSFVDFEVVQFEALVENTLSLVRILPARPFRPDMDIPGQGVYTGILARDTSSLWRSDTIVGCLSNMTVTGPMWLVSGTAPMQWRPGIGTNEEKPLTFSDRMKILGYRALYLFSLLLLVLFSIAVLALTGGTICRLSAMELAGHERASLSEVFLFALRRLWTFIKAPITPLIIIFVVGLLLTAIGLIGAIPYAGEIILGVFFIGLLLIAFILMLLVLGILGGLNLLFPTIAVEGSDAFDAMSRSFAYVYARPWKLIFYTLLSLVYGVITYLFVSFAVYLILIITHTFAGWGFNLFGNVHGKYSGLAKLETLWPAPKFGHLIASTNWYAMSWSEYIGSLFLHFWVYLFAAAIAAFVISYYFSAHTIIYLLLRRSVDGQSSTDIYLEEPVPTPAPSAPAAPAVTSVATTTEPAPPAPPV